MKELLEALGKVQAELKAPKNQYNSFSNFNYRSAEDILEAVKPLLKANNLTMIITDSMKQVGDRYYLEAKVKLYGYDSEIEALGIAREPEQKKGMDEAQITGATSSYARKYALNGMFNIDDTKDADTDEHHKTTSQLAKPNASKQFKASTSRPASEKQLDYIKTLATQQGVSEEAIKARLKQITTASEASEAIAKLTGKEQ